MIHESGADWHIPGPGPQAPWTNRGDLGDRNDGLAPARRMEFRIGVHLGDVISDDGRIYGDGVNIAARLEGLAQPGGICISAAVHEQIRGKLDIDCEDIGEQRVKNIARPVRVLRVRMGGQPMASATRQLSRRRVIIGSIATLRCAGRERGVVLHR